MKYADTWIRIVKEVTGRYQKTLATCQQFDNEIRTIVQHPNSPLKGLVYEIQCQDPFDELKLGHEATGGPTHHSTYPIKGNRQISCVLKLWLQPMPGSPIDVEDTVMELFNAFWKSSIRASPSGLISIKDFSEASDYAQNTLDEMISHQIISSVLFCDLDKFKIVNDKLGKRIGDRVIQEFASLLERVAIGIAIPLNNGGDEFILFCPNGSHEEALLLAYAIKNEVNQHNFEIGKFSVDVSIGIATNVNIESPKTFLELLNLSEKALTEEVKEKTRGLARFPVNLKDINLNYNTEESLKLAFCITKTNLLSPQLYNNVWLNALSMFISRQIYKNGFSESIVKDSVKSFLNWANFRFNPKIIKTAIVHGQEPDLQPEVSLLDIAIAISHSIMGSNLSNFSLTEKIEKETKILIYSDKDYNLVCLVFSPNRVIWSSDEEEIKKATNKFDLGNIWASQKETNITAESLRLSLLIKIGHKELNLPRELFAEEIVVDDRPTKGGGLPDFWEATIARLIGGLSKNQNISLVFVIGDKIYGAQTIKRLKESPKWDPNFIHQKTGMPVPAIQEASKRLENHLRIVETEEEIISILASLLQTYHQLLPINESSIIDQKQRFLERELKMDSQALTQEDGCRVRTISEAFPTVLEIARKAKEKAVIHDQAGRELLELVDFKVHLTEPLHDRVPKFYVGQEKSLKDYYEYEFLSDNGLFGKIFMETNQLEEVINHTVQAIIRPPKPFATRRAILVVPHKPESGKELSPLGLVSVRCIPRFKQEKIILNYSYTWRTVEAFVGFPYSIYGSVCYSEFLTDKIRKKLPPHLQKNVEMGFVSYIAHSLHTFIDEYGQNIAKRIVDDASI